MEQADAELQKENGHLPTYRQSPLSREKYLAILSETLKSLIATDQYFEADRPAVGALFLETRTLLRYCWARS